MTERVPAWVRETVRYESDAKGDVTDCQVLKEGTFGKLAVVSTSDERRLVVRQGVFGGETFDIKVTFGGGQTTSQVAATGAGTQVVQKRKTASRTKATTSELSLPKEAPRTFGDVHPVVDVEGIGPTYEARLNKIGIEDTHQLWAADTSKVAEHLGAPTKTVHKWQAMAELIGVNGLGPQYAELLVRSGITSTKELAGATPAKLLETIQETEGSLEVSIQGNVIGKKRVAGWIEAARDQLDKPGRARPATPSPEGELTQLKGIGATRAKRLNGAGISTLGDLVEADAEQVAKSLDVTVDRVRDWQQAALSGGYGITDLTEVKGIGPARANQLMNLGIRSQAELAKAGVDDLAQELGVSPKAVESWQAAIR